MRKTFGRCKNKIKHSDAPNPPNKTKISAANIKRTITSMLELPKEIVFNLPLISIIGSEEINIENYKGVIEYNLDTIRINTTCGVLKIEGKNLSLKQITSENILVNGSISRLEYVL